MTRNEEEACSRLIKRQIAVSISEARFPGKWAFFTFDDSVSAEQIPHHASCYSCHEQHAAVDTTFVQFYPTLLEIAKKKGTLSSVYLKEEAATAKAPPSSKKHN